jgi:Fur family ferric uptake transcriptional regulator
VTADQLYEMLRDGKDTASLRISRATVYRTLSLLTEGGFVQALDLGRESGTLYEHTLGHEHHDHMVCLDCGRIYEFYDERLERAQEAAVKSEGFHATSHRLNVFGTCARCAQKAPDREASAEG